MEFCALASGSSGNCIYVGHEDTHILVDAGISCKRIGEGLESIGVCPESIRAILITHDHSDHIQGAALFAKKYNKDIYATRGTLDYIVNHTRYELRASQLHPVCADESFNIGAISVMPFTISHDAIDPVGYTFETPDRKLGMATDLGVYNDYVIKALEHADALYLEANHDVNMLMLGSYPYYLKQRISSNRGHLSNEACAELVTRLRTQRLKAVVLAHISKENNFEELAYETVHQAVLADKRFENIPRLMVARRTEPSDIIQL